MYAFSSLLGTVISLSSKENIGRSLENTHNFPAHKQFTAFIERLQRQTISMTNNVKNLKDDLRVADS